MKKLSSVIIALLLATVLLFSIAGCSSDKQSKTDGLQSQIEKTEAKLAETEGKLTETKTKLAEMEKQISELNERINQLEKQYSDKIYALQEAYDNGWLTQDDLLSIAYYNNHGRVYNEEIMSEDYAPAPKTPEVLSEETELKIKTAYAKYYNKIYNTDKTAEDFFISDYEYYGTYNGCVAVIVDIKGVGYPAMIGKYKIYNITFYLPSYAGPKISVYKL